MKAEIIVVGDEVLMGQTADTNSNFIARHLAQAGMPVGFITVVPDEREAMLNAFNVAFHRSDVVMITGGLGPTHDDLTKGLLAKFFNLPIIFRKDLLEQVKDVYHKRQLQFVETSREQAEFPEGALAIANHHGTAPGIWIERKGRIYVSMPGVPYEMRAMMRETVLPKLRKKISGEMTIYRSIHTYGIKEAALYGVLDNRPEILEQTALAFLPAYGGVKLRITATCRDREEGIKRLDKAEALIREKIERHIYGVGEDVTLPMGVGERLKRAGKKLVVAESCTGGLLGKLFTDIPGSSGWFERGFITYSNEAKHELLAVPMELIIDHGAVSPQVVKAMAEGALRNSHANCALSITGIAGPDGGTDEKPVGLVYIGYADASTVESHRFVFDTQRDVNRKRAASSAMMILMDHLIRAETNSDPVLI